MKKTMAVLLALALSLCGLIYVTIDQTKSGVSAELAQGIARASRALPALTGPSASPTLSLAPAVLPSPTNPAEDEEPQELRELSALQDEIEKIYERTRFSHEHMTEKEYEDSIALLKAYNDKVRRLLEETRKGVSL